MMESTLNQVQRLLEQLTPSEQASLLSTLATRMSYQLKLNSSPAAVTATEAWEEFFRLGDMLDVGDLYESTSMTANVLKMRR